ncbi:hypothetical protein QYE76_019999 [Lolium multiflorum]|uniref:F-box domain-containing protein n=1 Tax=Lolium multiflorum TaxID=4521 RepID=A0AAD8R526_LOLMU|nr:hypothetical protein QYE76_019999 [Lolium multiflorum]
MGPFATDVLVEILLRLPPNSRRRSRLVCRRWRHLVDKRTTTDLRSRAQTLLVAAGAALVLGDDVGRSPRKVLASAEGRNLSVVGTCNGLICLCDDGKPPGAVALANPATGERLVLPPLPCGADIIIARDNPAWHSPYSFAHHQTTGRYAVVHVPCCFNRVYEFHTLQVFTLGEAAWRDVRTPWIRGAAVGCHLDIGVVSVDGATYWVAEATDEIISFDLGDERVTPVKPLPMQVGAGAGAGWSRRRLTEVHGRLGMAIFCRSCNEERTKVWLLGSARGEQMWALHYAVEIDVGIRRWLTHHLLMPHFRHGEHVLCVNDRDLVVYLPTTSPDGVLEIDDKDLGAVIERKCYVHKAFAHVETKEPLSIYKLW